MWAGLSECWDWEKTDHKATATHTHTQQSKANKPLIFSLATKWECSNDIEPYLGRKGRGQHQGRSGCDACRAPVPQWTKPVGVYTPPILWERGRTIKGQAGQSLGWSLGHWEGFGLGFQSGLVRDECVEQNSRVEQVGV